ncbi:MAG: putative toxin-antitoxin system toxin component, PIN family [Deltaproteobacteria bacterium]|nr:MAG: putative toxin-antitoxin system toxin component, PIN family [Deltaproteobacteria bacterium]HEC32187.1 putative toxin-antitoxin system toxin component, PIN family [Deltaproteobacteria bacterium]
MKIFLDTNVLISAVATRGLCADVFREVILSHQLVISRSLLSEIKRVLTYKLGVPDEFVTEFIEIIERDPLLSDSSPLAEIDIRDRDDVVILSAALNAGVDFFITGDKELLALRQLGTMEIISPREFWDRLTRVNKG